MAVKTETMSLKMPLWAWASVVATMTNIRGGTGIVEFEIALQDSISILYKCGFGEVHHLLCPSRWHASFPKALQARLHYQVSSVDFGLFPCYPLGNCVVHFPWLNE